MLTFADILEALTGERPIWAGQVVTQAAIDSRQAIPGGLFIALPGEQVDGHDFVADAFERGAHLAFVQRDLSNQFPVMDVRQPQALRAEFAPELPLCFWVDDSLAALQKVARFWRRKLQLRVIGITGSVGKSTTKELVAEVLDQRYRTLKNPGNLNNEIGLPLTLLDPWAKGTSGRCWKWVFMCPVKSRSCVTWPCPQVGVITNIGTVHAERAGSQEAIARGKAELVQALPPAPKGVAILNYDDPWVRDMASQTQAQVFYYGTGPAGRLVGRQRRRSGFGRHSFPAALS